MKTEDKIILVHYLNTDSISAEEFHKIGDILKKELSDEGLGNCFCYFVPTEGDNRVECINPKLVDEKAYEEAKSALEKHKELLEKALEKFKTA